MDIFKFVLFLFLKKMPLRTILLLCIQTMYKPYSHFMINSFWHCCLHSHTLNVFSFINPAPTAGCKMLASRHTWTAMTKWPAECPGTSVPRMPWRYKCYTDPRVVKKGRAKIRGTSKYRWTKSWHSSSGQTE